MAKVWLAVTMITLGDTLTFLSPALATCLDAGRRAEQRNGLPSGLLGSISRIESGNWTWSVNSNDANYSQRFTNAEEAEVYVQSLLDRGRRLIDIGCFQIDLFYHPEAFARWQDAFDDERAADAAARILDQLHRSTGDWNQAIALYHSANPTRGTPYLSSVLRTWNQNGTDIISSLPIADPHVVTLGLPSIPVAIRTSGSPTELSRRGSGSLPRVITP